MPRNTWRGAAAKNTARVASMKALHDGAEAILTESQDEVPHDTGTLQRSGTVTYALREDAVYISYNTPYARRQHEDLTFRHEEGRKAKYLEDPYNRNVVKVKKLVDLRVKKALQDER
jgi:hypothetical protein